MIFSPGSEILSENNAKKTPELLAPAGDMECLEAAVRFGANAVYLGGTEFGMRTASANFSLEKLSQAVRYAHENGVRVYLTCNTLPRSDELGRLSQFLPAAAQCGIDAFIVTDIGTLSLLKRTVSGAEIHISTQAGITNYESARVYYGMGAKRIIPARELSLAELHLLRENIPDDMDIECFVHGSMCVSFSGRCLLSNYLTGRDSNRGDCAQPCRWKYNLVEEKRQGEYYTIGEDGDGTYILNARDMCMINHVPQLIEAGVTSFKIEGRAKSAYYVSVITNAYRCAIDGYMKNPSPDYTPEKWISDEVYKVSHRDYCTGFYFGAPSKNAQIYYDGMYKRYYETSAIVLGCSDGFVECEQRNKFFRDEELEVLEPGKQPFTVRANELQSEDGEPLESVPHPMMHFKFRSQREIAAGAIIRRLINTRQEET